MSIGLPRIRVVEPGSIAVSTLLDYESGTASLPRRAAVSRELINGLETMRIIVLRRLRRDEILRRFCVAACSIIVDQLFARKRERKTEKPCNRGCRNRVLRRSVFFLSLANFYA